VFHSCHHSEKLAIALRLITQLPGYSTPNRKNSTGLRRLSHLHKVHFKKRQESNHGEGCQFCFHHLEDGVCSCMDYWWCPLSLIFLKYEWQHQVSFLYLILLSGSFKNTAIVGHHYNKCGTNWKNHSHGASSHNIVLISCLWNLCTL